ncbi:histone-fold-containing protein [Thelonectria olida]|uniref:Histone-fold-containing protein n=1 Tax=Thelonectria olida TaxID=1576542 RepID=A0A9P9AW12_9HYPO|nr:histone-fold-containing protein [Thelonectria olida]
MPYNTTAIPPRKEPTGQTQLPLSRVKKIIAQDPDIHICSNNAAFVITLAAEMFIQHLTTEAQTQAKLERKPRRNIQYKDVANAVSHQDNLEFLEDVVPKTVPYKKIKAFAAATRAAHGSGNVADDQTPTANGTTKKSIVNGNSPFSAPAREGNRKDDPNAQLELEMRQANGDGDVTMGGF